MSNDNDVEMQDHWMKDFFCKYRANQTYRNYGNNKHAGFYTHCECCDRVLLKFQQPSGLCGECFDVVNDAANLNNLERDRYYVENELWKNPQGSLESEFAEIAKKEEDDGEYF